MVSGCGQTTPFATAPNGALLAQRRWRFAGPASP
jgi:hypothetical protein